MSPQPRLVIGTAGHVDHGKTALIQRLTGINTDRWREEQERGLTLDLGFAYFDLPSGDRAGIVDVPGHERFIHNMLAGVSGIDVVMLTVAADEGVMPQTREHVAILDLLGVSRGVVVITKADRADEDLIGLVREEATELLARTPLAGSPVVVTSAVTGQGLDELVAELDRVAEQVQPRDIEGPARMPVDRSFTIAGHGTVVTGSLQRGRLREGQEVEIIPAGLRSRLRRLEVHGETVREVAAPARVGVNTSDVAKGQVARGAQVVEPGSMRVAWLLDVELRMIAAPLPPLKQRALVRLHIGTAEVNARVVLLDGREALSPGDVTFAQLRLEQPVAAAAKDHFVIRGSSPLTTLGGGVVLDPRPGRHRAGRSEVLQALTAAREGSDVDRVVGLIARRGRAGITAEELRREMQLTGEAMAELLGRAAAAGRTESLAGRWVSAEQAAELRTGSLRALQSYHGRRPLQAGMPVRDLGAEMELDSQPLQELLAGLTAQGAVVMEEGRVRLAEHRPSPGPAQQARIDEVLRAVQRGGFQPPTRGEVLAPLGAGEEAQDLLAYMIEHGDVVVLADLVYASETVEQARALLREHFAGRSFTAAEARDALGSTRRFVVPLLEHLDRSGFTLRRGDDRRIREEGG